jgi:hypothetical protein
LVHLAREPTVGHVKLEQQVAWRESHRRNVGRVPGADDQATRIGIGFERTGSRELNASWLDRCAFRFGGAFTSTYLSVNTASIDEWSISAGTTVPLSGETRIALAVEGGQRGTTASGLIKDTIVRVHLALLVSEIWFTRPEDE